VKGLARRTGIVALCVLSLVACVGLAWWQWQRFESSSGTWQNLGYVLQWPLFGLFPAFMFWRLRKLRAESREQAQQPAPKRAESHPTPPAETDKPVARQDVPREDAHDDDPELAAYNRMLAQLNARDQQETR
jgi:DNA-binding transcriptional regulator of glucitol operon